MGRRARTNCLPVFANQKKTVSLCVLSAFSRKSQQRHQHWGLRMPNRMHCFYLLLPRLTTTSGMSGIATHFSWVLADYGGKLAGSGLVHLLATRLQCGEKLAHKLLEAVAESSVRSQQQVFHDVCDYIDRLVKTGDIEAKVLLHHVSVDETPLKVRVSWDSSGRSYKGIAKVFVVEGSWSALLKLKRPESPEQQPEHVSASHLLRGTFSPSLRAANGTVGECVAGVLRSVWHPPERLQTVLQRCVRLTESDEAGSNTRGERLYSHLQPHWCRAQVYCLSGGTSALTDPVAWKNPISEVQTEQNAQRIAQIMCTVT